MLNWFNILTIYSNTSILMNKVANYTSQLTACIPLELFVVNKSINDRNDVWNQAHTTVLCHRFFAKFCQHWRRFGLLPSFVIF